MKCPPDALPAVAPLHTAGAPPASCVQRKQHIALLTCFYSILFSHVCIYSIEESSLSHQVKSLSLDAREGFSIKGEVGRNRKEAILSGNKL